MKNLILSLALCLGFSGASLAQGPPDKPHRPDRADVESMRIAFITTEVGLSSDQAKVFWPIYEEREAKLKAVHADRKAMFEAWNKEDLSDKEAKDLLEKRFQMEEDRLKIERAYHAKFLEVLSPVQVGKLYHAQEKFKRELVRRMRDKDAVRERGRERK